MKKVFLLIAVIILAQPALAQYNYPTTKTIKVTDTYHGTTITDSYRWLEDVKNPEVLNWFKTQAEYTNTEMAKIPNQDKLIQEFQQLDAMRSVSYSSISKVGGNYFYKKRLPSEQVSKLYCKQGENGKEILLFEPQQYIPGKTFEFSITVSDDGSKIAMNLSEAGSELGDIRILDVATKQFLPDVIPHSGYGEFVEGSNTEIMYTEFKNYDTHDPENALNTPFKLHVIGTSVDSDLVIASSKKNPELNIQPKDYPDVDVFKNSPYMILGKYTVENNLTLYYAPKTELKLEKINWKPLTTENDEIRQFFVQGKDIYFLTTKGNDKFKIIKTSFDKPDLQNATIIDQGNKEWKISPDYIAQSKDYLIYNKTKNELTTKTYQYEYKTGKTTEINVPLKGNILALGLSKEDNEVLFVNLGWTIPHNFYSYNASSQKVSKGIFNIKLNYPNIDQLVYKEVQIPSWDGTLVPLSIVYNKSKLKKDGSNITFMEGYGAYGFSYFPLFDEYKMALLNRGVILAYAHVRGGGEKGNEWYLAGKKTTKPNTWKDFNACTEWLINNNYSSADKFGISGASAGGILIGRAITERPDLYKVAIPKVGCLNTLIMEFEPNGPTNIPEFGTVTIKEEFEALLEMDAFHHIIKDEKYPAQLITTGFNDPRVESYIPAKFAAKMQAINGSENPVFLYVDYKAGHFGGSTIKEQFAQTAKEYAFLLWQCGNEEFQKQQ